MKKRKKEDKISKKENYKKEHLGISSFTLSIAGFFVTLFTPLASFVMFVVALVFSIIQQKRKPTKMGKLGLILSIIGIVLDIAFVILLVLLMTNLAESGLI